MSLQVLFLWSFINIWGLLFSICMYLYIPKYRSFYIFIDRCWFMFIPLVRYLDVVVLTCFPMYMPLLCCVFGYTQLLQVQDSQTQCGLSFPRICCIILHIHGSVLSFIILAWYDLVAKLWSCAAIIRPVLMRHWLVVFWSTSASLVLFGYLSSRAFSFPYFDSLS